MIRETLQLWLAPDTDTATLEQTLHDKLSAVTTFYHFGGNLEGSVGGGDYTVDLHWQNEVDADLLSGIAGIDQVDRMTYDIFAQGCQPSETARTAPNTVWRTLLLRVKPTVSPAAVEQFEKDMLAMPAYIGGIKRWALGRVSSESRWTHVWQQEFALVEDLVGEYLLHPYHWAWVDHYFDADFPDCLVDPHISHNFCPLQGSIIEPQQGNLA